MCFSFVTMRVSLLSITVIVALLGCEGTSRYFASSDVQGSSSEEKSPATATSRINKHNAAPAPERPPNEFAQQMLAAVNQARSVEQVCGNTRMLAVHPLEWNSSLAEAAYSQSLDMAKGDFLSHTSADGSTLSDRIERTDYPKWMSIGENVAAGQQSVEQVITAWMKSDGHCRNIMNEVFVQMGASIVQNPSGRYGTYWTQVFGVPMKQ